MIRASMSIGVIPCIGGIHLRVVNQGFARSINLNQLLVQFMLQHEIFLISGLENIATALPQDLCIRHAIKVQAEHDFACPCSHPAGNEQNET